MSFRRFELQRIWYTLAVVVFPGRKRVGNKAVTIEEQIETFNSEFSKRKCWRKNLLGNKRSLRTRYRQEASKSILLLFLVQVNNVKMRTNIVRDWTDMFHQGVYMIGGGFVA